MTIEWLAGNRLKGTTAERPSASLQSPSVGGWKEVGRTTLSGTSSSVDLSSSNKRYYMVLCTGITTSTNGDYQLEYNGDASGGDYNNRTSFNGGTDYQENGVNYLRPLGTTNGMPFFDVNYVANKSDKEKLVLGQAVQSNGTGTGTGTLTRSIYVGKYTNTSAAVNEIKAKLRVGTFDSGELVVLGYDPDDTHTDNFWEELADVTLGSDASEISSGTIQSKKYLWCQVYVQNASNSNDVLVRFKNDTGSNYTQRHAINYGSDTTQTSGSSIKLIDRNATADTGRFANFFAINHSAKEKLLIAHGTEEETSGAGNPPTSNECVGKWVNTSSQITEIDCFTESGNIRSGARLRVWGSN